MTCNKSYMSPSSQEIDKILDPLRGGHRQSRMKDMEGSTEGKTQVRFAVVRLSLTSASWVKEGEGQHFRKTSTRDERRK